MLPPVATQTVRDRQQHHGDRECEEDRHHPREFHGKIIAATNRDLKKEMAAGRFRSDLYFRLSVFPIQTPPLRERLADVILLASDLLEQAARRLNLAVPRLTAENIRELCSYDWPGNVRELQNVLERALIVSAGGRLRYPRVLRRRESSTPLSAGVQHRTALADIAVKCS